MKVGVEHMNEIMCFDCETGGFNPYKCGLCSVTLKVVGKDIIKTIFVKPTKNRIYDPSALKVNGLTLEQLEEIGVTEEEAVKEIKQFVSDNFITKPQMLAHNIVFDIQFMNALFARHSPTSFSDLCYYHPLDTMIFMKLLKDSGVINISRINLSSCYRHFFIKDFENAHTSEADVIATEELYHAIVKFMKTKK
jgi:DNA polymerase III epsilon subunit-like protein